MSDAVQSRRPAVRHVVGLALLALLASVLAWAVGLLWYIRLIDAAPPPVPPADGIVALTGGAGRVETALQLLAKGQAVGRDCPNSTTGPVWMRRACRNGSPWVVTP